MDLAEARAGHKKSIKLPDIHSDIHCLHIAGKHVHLFTPDGEFKTLNQSQAQQILHKQGVLLCNAPLVRDKTGIQDILIYDVLELFAFIHPARFCLPTIEGLAKFCGFEKPEDAEAKAYMLMEVTRALLEDLSREKNREKMLSIAEAMGLNGKGWVWTPFIFEAFGQKYDPLAPVNSRRALNIWKDLPEWSEDAPPPPPSHHGVSEKECISRLKELLRTQDMAEEREEQKQYANEIRHAFAPAQDENPNIVLSEAGTGVGKTLGYLAPASIWAEKNQGAVWISTYTKNLQKQIYQELDRLYFDPELKKKKTAIRKGRENYLCLLNFEDTAAAAGLAKDIRTIIAAGIMARWIDQSEDGDLTGADFPGWLIHLLGGKNTLGLTDRRGECIFSACDHYHRCFVERSIRKSKHANLVVTNHALVMIQAALASPLEALPSRYVFDEGHHLFDAADSAFSAHLSTRETADLRRWLLGAESGRQSRSRGLKKRLEDLVTDEEKALLEDILHKARILPAPGWRKRIIQDQAQGPAEFFFTAAKKQIFSREKNTHSFYSLETGVYPCSDDFLARAKALKKHLVDIQKPLSKLSDLLRKKLIDQADTMDSDTRKRLDALHQGLERKDKLLLQAWIKMLETVLQNEKPEDFVDWLEMERIDGEMLDIGLYRHWVDPVKPFAQVMKNHAQGMNITSATLRSNESWEESLKRTGASYLSDEPKTFSAPSPFDYKSQTRIFVVTDIEKNDPEQLASAYKNLFFASQGSALGIFTSIQRLKKVYQKITHDFEESGIPLYAQHIDKIDNGTLVDIFREDQKSCLLGTDAMRDGVDVPGDALRLIAFDRVPWPRPTILHKARRDVFGKKDFDDMLTRLKLKQAFGRLIRRQNDRGIFVILDSMLPSRLIDAFPPDVSIERIGLKDTLSKTEDFFGFSENEKKP